MRKITSILLTAALVLSSPVALAVWDEWEEGDDDSSVHAHKDMQWEWPFDFELNILGLPIFGVDSKKGSLIGPFSSEEVSSFLDSRKSQPRDTQSFPDLIDQPPTGFPPMDPIAPAFPIEIPSAVPSGDTNQYGPPEAPPSIPQAYDLP